MGTAGININFLNGRPNPLRIKAGTGNIILRINISTIIVGIRTGTVVLGRSSGLINGRKTINFNYIKTFKGINILK